MRIEIWFKEGVPRANPEQYFWESQDVKFVIDAVQHQTSRDHAATGQVKKLLRLMQLLFPWQTHYEGHGVPSQNKGKAVLEEPCPQ